MITFSTRDRALAERRPVGPFTHGFFWALILASIWLITKWFVTVTWLAFILTPIVLITKRLVAIAWWRCWCLAWLTVTKQSLISKFQNESTRKLGISTLAHTRQFLHLFLLVFHCYKCFGRVSFVFLIRHYRMMLNRGSMVPRILGCTLNVEFIL